MDDTPCLSRQEAEAIGDNPEIPERHYKKLRKVLFQLVRNGRIRSEGVLWLRNENNDRFGQGCKDSEDTELEKLIAKYGSILDVKEDRQWRKDTPIPIPPSAWRVKVMDTDLSHIYYSNGKIELIIDEICVSASDLEELRSKQKKTKSGQKNIDDPVNNESLLKLVAAMAYRGYKFDPQKPRNTATSEIMNDLDELGLPLDRKTVLHWLREAGTKLPK